MSVSSTLRLAFMGTPDFAVPALHALKDAGHNIITVYSQPPKPAGRGQHLRKSPVQHAAEQMGIEVHTPQTLRDPKEQEKFAALNLDMAIVAAYGLILPLPLLQAPTFGCLNIHASLLPRWRGAAPIQRALLAGDAETGITIMQMAEGLDTGDTLLMEKLAITPTATAGSLHDELAHIGARLIVHAVAGVAAGTREAVPQPSSGVHYAAKLTREDGRIDWTNPAATIERQIRALQPWPGCFFILKGEPVKVLAAKVVGANTAPPGTLLDAQFTVACGTDALRITKLQRSGKNATDGASFLHGIDLPVGQQI